MELLTIKIFLFVAVLLFVLKRAEARAETVTVSSDISNMYFPEAWYNSERVSSFLLSVFIFMTLGLILLDLQRWFNPKRYVAVRQFYKWLSHNPLPASVRYFSHMGGDSHSWNFVIGRDNSFPASIRLYMGEKKKDVPLIKVFTLVSGYSMEFFIYLGKPWTLHGYMSKRIRDRMLSELTLVSQYETTLMDNELSAASRNDAEELRSVERDDVELPESVIPRRSVWAHEE